MRYEYDAILHELPENGGAYVSFPWDLRKETGKDRLKVHTEFGSVPYDGSKVNSRDIIYLYIFSLKSITTA